MICSKCNTHNDNASKFCKACGIKFIGHENSKSDELKNVVEKIGAPAKNSYCISCGASIKSKIKYCPSCGSEQHNNVTHTVEPRKTNSSRMGLNLPGIGLLLLLVIGGAYFILKAPISINQIREITSVQQAPLAKSEPPSQQESLMKSNDRVAAINDQQSSDAQQPVNQTQKSLISDDGYGMAMAHCFANMKGAASFFAARKDFTNANKALNSADFFIDNGQKLLGKQKFNEIWPKYHTKFVELLTTDNPDIFEEIKLCKDIEIAGSAPPQVPVAQPQQKTQAPTQTQPQQAQQAPIAYIAELSCIFNGKPTNITPCFIDGSYQTTLELKNGDFYKMYQSYEVGNKVGYKDQSDSSYGRVVYIDLKNNFSIKTVNASSTFLLNLIVRDKNTGKIVFQKSASKYQTLYVNN